MKWQLVIDDAAFKAAIQKLKNPAPVNDMVEKAVERALDIAKKLTPGRGNVRKEWAAEFNRDAAGLTREAVIRNNYKDPKILEYLEWGTRAHVIRPKSGKFLKFFSKTSGKWVWTKRVDHPGTKAYDIVGTTRRFLISLIQSMKAAALARMVGK